jgi:tetratricopeptide (TPR) repeat protein
MSASVPVPLKGSAEREAVDSLRGYSYQILRSLEAWIELPNGAILILEGAEDLDFIEETGAATVEQVKDTSGSGNVTLRSPSVLEAIGNFWDHLGRNPGVAIEFRFLTTSGIGREKRQPFGFDIPGLEAWQRIRMAPSDTTSVEMAAGIQAFLKDNDTLSEPFRLWLGRASTEDFIARIVLPMEWVAGWPTSSDLYDTIVAKLVELGEKRDVSSADAVKALDALHTEAWRIATTKGSRVLRRGDLLRIFDQAGTTAIPNSQLLALLGVVTGAQTGSTDIAVAPEPFSPPPRVIAGRHPRPALEGAIRGALEAGTVLIYGGTGMGKTALALAVIGSPEECAWLDLRDTLPATAASRIDAVAARINETGRAYDVVLDDLPAGGDARSLEGPLGRLRSVQDRLSGTLLVTVSDRLPARLATQIALDPARTFAAPAFEVEDIDGYLAARGCPAPYAESWAKLIHASTSGHPQLVDARVSALTDEGFPKPDLSELLTVPAGILDVRSEARRLVATRPPEDRELLARTSLLLGRASRDRLMAVAQIRPPILEPGDVIDRLTGPWLERLDSDNLRASPLLRNLGIDTRGQEWVTGMHRGIANSFLKGGSLLATDIFEIATHAMLGGSAAPLIPILPGLLQASPEVWEQVAQTASMLIYMGLDGTTLPFRDPLDTAAFRILQIRIAIEMGDHDRASDIVAQALKEFDAADEAAVPGPGLFEVVFLWQVLQRPGNISLEERLRLSIRFVKAGARTAEVLRKAVPPEGIDPEDMHFPDLSAFVPMALVPAVSDVEDFARLLDLVEGLDEEDRATALGGYAGDGEAAALALDRIWLGEASRSEPRWSDLERELKRAIALGDELSIAQLGSAAAPLLIRVIDENLKQPDAAVALADAMITDDARPARVLTAKAKVLWRRGQAAEAMPLYEEALPVFPLGLSWKTDALREAAMAAGKVKDWPLAARRLTEAVANLSEDEPLVRHVGFRFDLAIALQLSFRTREAVNRLGEAIDLLMDDGQETPPEPFLSVRQVGSQAIKSIGFSLGLKGLLGDPQMPLETLFGSTSSLEELRWGDQQPAPLDVVALVIAELDVQLPEYPLIAERLARNLRASPDLLAQSTQGDLLTRLAVRTLDVADGADDAIREVRALAFAVAEREAGRDTAGQTLSSAPIALEPRWQELVKYRLLARVVAMIAAGKASAIPIEVWREAVSRAEMADVLAMVDDLGRMIDGSEDASRRILGGNASWNDHLLAALMAPVQRPINPDQQLICHAVAARYLHQGKLTEFVAQPFSALVTDAWLDRCDNPAQLVTPRLTVPAIRRAATSTAAGWLRVLAVLEDSRHAVSASTSSSLNETLDELRKAVAG